MNILQMFGGLNPPISQTSSEPEDINKMSQYLCAVLPPGVCYLKRLWTISRWGIWIFGSRRYKRTMFCQIIPNKRAV